MVNLVPWRIANNWRRASQGARRLWNRALFRVTERQLHATLTKLVGNPRRYLLVHSSLSACGHVCDGAATVIRVLAPFAGTLCLPTHTYCYPADPTLPGPVFDLDQTPSCVGQITDYFRALPGVVRSLHPSHSLAAHGPEAAELCDGHVACATPCGANTPYEKLVERDASVLMFGATMNAYTLFHTAEDGAACPYLYEAPTYQLQARDQQGVVWPVPMKRQDMSVRRRFAAMDSILEQAGLLHRARLGKGELLLIPSALAVHGFLMDHLARDPYYLVDENYRRRSN